ncbi:MAG: TetR/AcrR family transcriptional regulator [Deltaproteobacteria bacterium]|nr:TetR/AcrR family transcriptional regulator [Deltaproteobacteria bacterium]
MARRDIKEARKDNIIDAALQVFTEKGYANATMTDIAKKAGVSTPVLYGYFKTKEDLLFTIPEKLSEEPVRTLDVALPYFRGPEAKIRFIVQGYITLYENNPLYASLVMLELKTNRKFLKTKAYVTIQKVARTLLESIREGINDGTFKDQTDAFLVRSMILGTIEHLCINKILLGEPKDLQVYVDPLVDTILEGIKKPSKHFSINLSINNLEIADIPAGDNREDKQDKEEPA